MIINISQAEDNVKSTKIQGLESYTTDEVKTIVKFDIEVKGIELHGSRLRGNARANSDLDVVVEYDGNIREDDLFDILNEEPLYIDNVKVDINQ